MNDVDSQSAIDVDVVIVGSGIAGSLIANQLSHSGIRVVIIEAGKQITLEETVSKYRNSWQRTPQSAYERHAHALFPDRNADDPYLSIKGKVPYWCNYLRVAGGTTWHWGGITPRFLPEDFKLNSTYGVGKDWSITYQDIEPYYLRAEHELGVSGDSSDDHGSHRSGSYPMPPLEMLYSDKVISDYLKSQNLTVKVAPAARNSQFYQGRSACCGNNTCIPVCPSGAKYHAADIHLKRAIKEGAQLIENAIASAININNEGHIDSVNYKKPDGQIFTIKGKYYVLACNAIETPKLLLMSRSSNLLNGVANQSGLVGRGLMDHPIVRAQFLMPVPLYSGRGPQVVSTLDYGRSGNFRKKYSAGFFLFNNDPDLQSYVTDIIEVKKQWNKIDEDLTHFSTHHGALGALLEQLPDPDNYIKPSESELDAIGIPKPEIVMNINPYLEAAANNYYRFLKNIINYIGAKKIDAHQFGTSWADHPMGTTCMGNNPKISVVDNNCRSHDHPNLFIAGSSVFTTGSCVPPTLTIAALSLRLADHMEEKINRE